MDPVFRITPHLSYVPDVIPDAKATMGGGDMESSGRHLNIRLLLPRHLPIMLKIFKRKSNLCRLSSLESICGAL